MFSNFVSRLREVAGHINKQFSGGSVDASGAAVDLSGAAVDVSGAKLTVTVDMNRAPVDMSGRRLGFDLSDTVVPCNISDANICWTTDASGVRVFGENTTTFFRDPCTTTNQTVVYTCDSTWSGAYNSLNTTFIPQSNPTCVGNVCDYDSSSCGCPSETALECCGGVCLIKPPAIENAACSGGTTCSEACAGYETCEKKTERVACDSDACGTGAGCGTGGGCACKKSNVIKYD